MSVQIRFGITWGSGEKGVAFERRLIAASAKEGKPFPAWVKDTLMARANEILPAEQPVAAKEGKAA